MEILDPFHHPVLRRAHRRGRPWKDGRAVLNGILWVLRQRLLGLILYARTGDLFAWLCVAGVVLALGTSLVSR